MCGQAGIHRRTGRAIPRLGVLIDSLLDTLEYRGRDATGVLAMHDDGRVQVQRSITPASKFLRGRKRINGDSRTVLLHTRFATVGSRGNIANAHPVVSGSCAAVHNGTIWNHDDLFDQFDLPRRGTVDSEIIPALVDLAGWEHADEALNLMRGGAATAIVSKDHPTEVLLARLRDYPMRYVVTKDLVMWASTAEALQLAWGGAYGEWLPARKIKALPEFTMLRVNGRVTETALVPHKYVGPPKPTKKMKVGGRTHDVAVIPTKKPRKAISGAASTKATRRASAKSARRRRAQEAKRDPSQIVLDVLKATPGLETGGTVVTGGGERSPWTPPHEDPEEWMLAEVDDLMRQTGIGYDDAYEAVFGIAPCSAPEWEWLNG